MKRRIYFIYIWHGNIEHVSIVGTRQCALISITHALTVIVHVIHGNSYETNIEISMKHDKW